MKLRRAEWELEAEVSPGNISVHKIGQSLRGVISLLKQRIEGGKQSTPFRERKAQSGYQLVLSCNPLQNKEILECARCGLGQK